MPTATPKATPSATTTRIPVGQHLDLLTDLITTACGELRYNYQITVGNMNLALTHTEIGHRRPHLTDCPIISSLC